MAAAAERAGAISAADADTWLNQLADAGRRGHFFWAVTMFAVAAIVSDSDADSPIGRSWSRGRPWVWARFATRCGDGEAAREAGPPRLVLGELVGGKGSMRTVVGNSSLTSALPCRLRPHA